MGQVIGLIDDIPTVADLMRRIMNETAEAKSGWTRCTDRIRVLVMDS